MSKNQLNLEKHFKLTDDDFERSFRLCTLEPVLFTHEAHLRLTWIHLDKYGLTRALKNIQEDIKKYVSQLGAIDKYHVTVTIAAVHVVNRLMNKSLTSNFLDFIKENTELKTSFKELINSHYQDNIFELSKAQYEFIEPDKIPF